MNERHDENAKRKDKKEHCKKYKAPAQELSKLEHFGRTDLRAN
jgi:hypothetical protein